MLLEGREDHHGTAGGDRRGQGHRLHSRHRPQRVPGLRAAEGQSAGHNHPGGGGLVEGGAHRGPGHRQADPPRALHPGDHRQDPRGRRLRHSRPPVSLVVRPRREEHPRLRFRRDRGQERQVRQEGQPQVDEAGEADREADHRRQRCPRPAEDRGQLHRHARYHLYVAGSSSIHHVRRPP